MNAFRPGKRLFGRWLLLSTALAASPARAQDQAERPVVTASYVTDIAANVDGGVARGAAWLGRADLSLALPGPSVGLPGTFFADVIGIQGGDLSGRYVGDAQIVSNVQAPAALRLYELWYEAGLSRGLGVKLGVVDLNTEFDLQAIGAGFINSSFGVGPDLSQSGENGPSIFPAPAPALLVKASGGGWSARVGAFAATSGSSNPRDPLPRFRPSAGALLIAEGDRAIGGGREVQLGVWSYTKPAAAIDPAGGRERQRGAYAQIEGRLPGTSAAAGWDGWLRVGLAASRVLPISRYLGGGITLTRGQTRWGVGVAHARLGRSALRLDRTQRRAETAIEAHYARRLARWLSIQPAAQYVIHPSWVTGRSNATVLMLRVAVSRSTERGD